ncbi:hypothetical protein ANTPLA_LOCUS1328 [Anthophora plagiata]
MDFQTLSHLNAFVNKLSGNNFPMTSKKTKLPNTSKCYSLLTWLTQLTYVTVCILGLFNVPKEKALKDGTVNIVVALEAIVLIIYLHEQKYLLRKLIRELNRAFTLNNETLRNVTNDTVRSLEGPLKIYTIASVSSVVLWTGLPLVEVSRKNEFFYTDYSVPAVLSEQPFSNRVFLVGVVLQICGSAFTVVKKIGVDLYTIHLILLMTAQYKFLRNEFAETLRNSEEDFEGFFRDT